jgi:hypothetical protein
VLAIKNRRSLAETFMNRAVRWTLVFVLTFGVAFAAWPFWSGWQLRQAMRARDVASLQARVDWPTLRANLKPKLAAAVDATANESGGVTGYLKRVIGAAVADKGVDLFVTPANLSRILAGREFVTARLHKGAQSQPAQQQKGSPQKGANDPALADPEDPDDPMPPRRVRWAFFESPTRFRVEAVHPRLQNARIVAHLGLQGFGWKLVDVAIVEAR